MPFLGVVGAPRTGKNVLVTMMLVNFHKQAKLNEQKLYLFANYHFLDEMKSVVQYIEKPQDYLNVNLPELSSGIAVFDELWAWFESRGSGSSIRTSFVRQIANQSGKRGFDVVWISQLSSMVDLTIRRQTYKFFKSFPPTENYFRYGYTSSTYYAGRRLMRLRLKKTVASQYYKYYDTREIIRTLNPEDFDSAPKEMLLIDSGELEPVEEFEDTKSENQARQIEDNLSNIPDSQPREGLIPYEPESESEPSQQQNQEEKETERQMKTIHIEIPDT